MSTRETQVWSPTKLHRHLNDGSRFAILDVRNRDEFDAWKIEGKSPIQTVNIPYFDLLELRKKTKKSPQRLPSQSRIG